MPSQGTTVDSVMKAKYKPYLENFSASALHHIAKIDSLAPHSMKIKSIALFAGTHQKLQALWLARAPKNFTKKLRKKYAKTYRQNHYKFHGITILNLLINGRKIFATQLHNLLLLSFSSRAIEQSIRAYRGNQPAADLAHLKITPGKMIMNTPALDKWLSRIGRVQYQQTVKKSLKGTSACLLKIGQFGKNKDKQYSLSGTFKLQPKKESSLVKTFAHPPTQLNMSKYISSDAAGFGVFQNTPSSKMPDSLADTTKTDAYFLQHPKVFSGLANDLTSQFSIELFAHSGFQSRGEYLYMRKLHNPGKFQSQLDTLSQQNLLSKTDSVYFTQSHGLGQMLGSDLCNFKSFYINIVDSVAVIAKRKGLAKRVTSDYNQRNVVAYNPFYQKLMGKFPKKLSGFFVTAPGFDSYLTPLISNHKYIRAFTSRFKYLALTTQLGKSGKKLSINLSTFSGNKSYKPYQEDWFYNTRGARLSGPPIFGNIGGSRNNEVIFATKSGQVYALAADGTIIRQYSTGSDVPVGSPVVYDWYGTGNNVILIAAGNKIYGWDKQGNLLPNFPLTFAHKITTPLTVADINHNRTPDAIVGTSDRKLHVVDGHGRPLSGWPVNTNAPIHSAPFTGYFEGQAAVVAYSSNTVHAWDPAGDVLPGYPLFAGAALQGSPIKFKNALLGNAVDGRLYAMGNGHLFPDSMNVYKNSNSGISAINISGSALTGSPYIYKNRILTTSQNGSVFLLNSRGRLLLTKSMGEPSAPNWSSQIVDINGNGKEDMLALSKNGRLYGWQISSGKKLKDLPKAGISLVNIGDIQNDGLKEIVGQTDKGVECWTINPKEKN
ncbi:MAG TPA: hypothetical protein VE868_01345 [Balneolaceae bacterium]|nr:hypothetical protein [Balneolaceae bacterium]